jgi:hypothetical protein
MKIASRILFFLGLTAILATGCTNKELESRIAKLEGKVAELETKNGTRDISSTRTTPQAQQPEVKPDGPLPEFKFNEEMHDFGTINEGDIVTHVFEFTNTGDAPLIVSSATASCGCTVPEKPEGPIAPGESGQIKVQFNSRKKPGIQNKTVTITANTYPKITRLRIKANVLKAQDPA